MEGFSSSDRTDIMIFKYRFFLLPAAIFLSSCSLHKVDTNPEPLTGTNILYSNQKQAVTATDKAGSAWYQSLGNKQLNSLVSQALDQNFNIRSGLARLEAAKALSAEADASLYPAIDSEVSLSKSRSDGQTEKLEREAGVSLDWETDIFGRLRELARGQEYEVRAAASDVAALRLFLAADMAEAYYNALAQARQLALLDEQAKDDKEFLNLTELRFKSGVGTNVEVLQQKSQLNSTLSLIPPVEAARRVFENRIDVLAGQVPDAVDRIDALTEFPHLEENIALGVPSDLLLNRPDLAALRNRLIAQDAEIGAAIAERLPRITLTGSYVVQGGGTVAGPVANVLLGLVQPLIDWGRRKAEVERNKALYSEQLTEFTQSYLEAIEDVENALYQENRQREYIRRLQTQADILEKNLAAAQAVYKQGLSDYLPVLDALKQLRVVERALVEERRDLVLLRIALYRALGGQMPPEENSGTLREEDTL